MKSHLDFVDIGRGRFAKPGPREKEGGKLRIAFGEHSVVLHSWESKDQLLRFLSQCEEGSVLLGSNAEQQIDFFSITVYLGWSGLRRFGIGICSEGCGLIPQLLLQSEINELFIGFNSEVVAFNLFDKKVLFRINLASLFRAFVHWRKNRILVFHEIGVVAINEDGREIWGYDKDIIEECKIDRDYLHLRFMDAEPVTISLVDGKKLSTTNR